MTALMGRLRVPVHRRIPLVKIMVGVVSIIGVRGVIRGSCWCRQFSISDGPRRPHHMTTGTSVGYGSMDQKESVKAIIEKNKDVNEV